MKERFYNWATMWLTLSVIFFLVEYTTNWLEVVTLGGLVAGAVIESFIVNMGLGLMWLIVSKPFKQAELAEAMAMYTELAKAIVVVAAFVWEGAITLAKLMPGYTMHTTLPHLIFLLLVYPLVGIVLEILIRKRSTLVNGN
ncbi:MAG: hypothetical protein U0K79_04300 [Phascolarctobacterium sp.]|nr:hypothetical protein [Phascolarctobacterium sp.]